MEILQGASGDFFFSGSIYYNNQFSNTWEVFHTPPPLATRHRTIEHFRVPE